MKRFTLCFLAFFTLLAAGCGENKQASDATKPVESVEINVSAAVSMKDALAEIQKSYESSHPNVKIVYNLGASGSLQKQIEQGAPADIFISAAAKQMDELGGKNLLMKESRKNLVENQLVLIVPQNSRLQLTNYEDLTKTDIQKIGLGEPAVVPAGQYAKQAFTKLGFWDRLQEKLVFAKDVRTVLAYVETGNVDAGIVYQTDAIASTKIRVIAAAPAGTHEPIIYPMAILANTKNTQAVQDFYKYLTGSEAKAALEKAGFTMSK